jgi:hypothetical protein
VIIMPEFVDRILIWFFAACVVIGIPAVVVNDIRAGSRVGSSGFGERVRLAGLIHITLAVLLSCWLPERPWRRRLAVAVILAGAAWLAWGVWRWPVPPLGLPDETAILMYLVTGISLTIAAWQEPFVRGGGRRPNG